MGRQGIRDGCRFSFYLEKQTNKNRSVPYLRIIPSPLKMSRMLWNVVSTVIKRRWALSINKQNKTAAYCFLPTKLWKIYKWITNVLSANNGMMVLVLLLAVDYRQKVVGAFSSLNTYLWPCHFASPLIKRWSIKAGLGTCFHQQNVVELCLCFT